MSRNLHRVSEIRLESLCNRRDQIPYPCRHLRRKRLRISTKVRILSESKVRYIRFIETVHEMMIDSRFEGARHRFWALFVERWIDYLRAEKLSQSLSLVNAYVCMNRGNAPVAQLDSASVFGTEGYRFESCRAYSATFTTAVKVARCCSLTVREIIGAIRRGQAQIYSVMSDGGLTVYTPKNWARPVLRERTS